MMKQISLGEFVNEISSLTLRPGLIFGPDVTRAPGEVATQFHQVFLRLGMNELLPSTASDSDYPSAFDRASQARPEKQEELRQALFDKLRSLKPTLEVPHLVKANWSAYVSLTEDLLLEEALRTHSDSTPSSRAVTIVDHPSVQPPSRSYPVYKLLGNLNDSNEERCLCLSDAESLLRKQSWPAMIRTLPDHLRDAPLLVLGCSTAVQRLRDALSMLASQTSPRITKLRFLQGDPCLSDPTIKVILSRFDVAAIDTNLRELCEQVSTLRTVARGSGTPAPAKTADRLVQDLTSHYDSPVSIVPSLGNEPLVLSQIDLWSCIDSLFRPASADWRPYQANLDLRRDCTDSALTAIRSQTTLATPGHPKVLLLVGEAGIGKTSVAKRVALESSKDSTLVLWCRRISSGSWTKAFRKLLEELFTQLKKGHENHFTSLIVVCDDPWGLRIDAADVLVALEKCPIKAVLVATMRNSDRHIVELRSTTASTKADEEVEVPFSLTDLELKRMSEMLVKIGAVPTFERGQDLIKTVRNNNARDILCSLWYLVPQTKSQLAESLKDEYFRLGEISSISDLAQTSSQVGRIAHKAYEFVTVSSRLDLGLPLEILVHALKIDYSDWTGSLENGRPIWGLLYDDASSDGSTIVYFTRNEIVTRVLIDLVNNGLAGHMGEVRVLKELIQACNGPSSVYRNYIVDIFVRARHKLEEFLTYEQGYELYELALSTLPSEDRLIEHHFGIWIQNKGPKDGTAYRQLDKALQTSSASGAEKDAPREHIHASMAAAALQQIRQGNTEWSTGADLVKHHLRLAASPTFFNAHTSHVAANLLFEAALLALQRNDQDAGGKFTIAAFEEIERAFHTVGAKGRTSFQFAKTLGMLGDLQRKILGLIPNVERLKVMATDLFNQGRRQTGFELASRRLLVEAVESGRGKDFNEVNNYLNDCMTVIENASAQPTADLLAVRVDLMIRWKIHGFKEVVWDAFRDDLIDILETPKFSEDVLKRFYLAVAYFHLDESREASLTFAQLRRDNATNHRPNEIRAYFQDSRGNPRRFQGTMRYVNGRAMVSIPELDFDAPLRIGSSGTTGLIHIYVGFSFNGLVAVLEQPKAEDLTLH